MLPEATIFKLYSLGEERIGYRFSIRYYEWLMVLTQFLFFDSFWFLELFHHIRNFNGILRAHFIFPNDEIIVLFLHIVNLFFG